MKKFLLSALFILGFASYATYNYLTGSTHTQSPQPVAVAVSTSGTASPTTSANSNTTSSSGQYKDGTYTSSVTDAYYGNMQVEAVISGGKLTDVIFLQYPNDRGHSVEINAMAMPQLKAEAIQSQSANVDGVSGASDSSSAFKQALASALTQAEA